MAEAANALGQAGELDSDIVVRRREPAGERASRAQNQRETASTIDAL